MLSVLGRSHLTRLLEVLVFGGIIEMVVMRTVCEDCMLRCKRNEGQSWMGVRSACRKVSGLKTADCIPVIRALAASQGEGGLQ